MLHRSTATMEKWLSKLEFKMNSVFCCPDLACTDSSGAPHAVGEIWRTSLSGCCMQKCVDSETIIPVEYNCSEIHNLECQRFAEVALLVPDDQTCCPQKICSKYSFMVVDTAHWNMQMSFLWGLLSCYACYFWRKWKSLPVEFTDYVEKCRNFLAQHPTDFIQR